MRSSPLLGAFEMPENVSILRTGLGDGCGDGRGLSYGRSMSSRVLDSCPGGRGAVPGAGRGVAYLTPCTPSLGPSASRRRGWCRDTGLDSLGSFGRAGC